MPHATIPVTRLILEGLPNDERFGAWRDGVSLLFEAIPDTPAKAAEASRITTYHLGSLLLSNAVSHEQLFQRSPRMVAQTGIDHFLVQVYRKGCNVGECGKTRLNARPGDVFLLDLSQTLSTRADDFDNLTLVVPRQLLCQHLKSPERFHGRLLPRESALGRLLNEHLHALWRASAESSPEEAGALALGVTGLVGAYFAHSIPPEDVPEIDAATGLVIRQYIARHFANPRLTPEFLAAHFQVSRAHLYRLFKPYGGVSEYIRDRRLDWSLMELSKPGRNQARIIDIALAAGFASESHFSRLFRQAYGITPKDARQGIKPVASPALGADGLLDQRHLDWLRTLA
jgi:AraC-like DNA-binding protein